MDERMNELMDGQSEIQTDGHVQINGWKNTTSRIKAHRNDFVCVNT